MQEKFYAIEKKCKVLRRLTAEPPGTPELVRVYREVEDLLALRQCLPMPSIERYNTPQEIDRVLGAIRKLG